ncbi:uncharacterized protein LOC135840451 [Planococcus citri]|uniref:uncharacterized protein LOC135840451 n=1 Tax=Planococcus citri TaxID=170843 RepID=UPI0031F880FD
MFAIKALNYRVYLCFAIFSTIRCDIGYQVQNYEENKKDYKDYLFSRCYIDIWNTGQMKADDLPSIFAIVQKGPDTEPGYFLPQFKTSDRILQIEFKHKEKLIIICHKGGVNYDDKKIECSNGKKVPDIDTIKECKESAAKPSLRDSETSCGDSTENKLFEIGYKVFPMYSTEQYVIEDENIMTNLFFPFINVCLDPIRRVTSYTSHMIDGKTIAGRQILSFIPEDFSMEGYHVIHKAFKTDADEVRDLKKTYRPQKQFHYLYTLFREKLRDYFDNEDYNFVPRQLTPDYDMLLKNWKSLTHYFINTAPQWKILACTWDALEDLIRERASQRNYEVRIYTGTYGILTLSDIEVFISPEKLSVPKYFWKIVLHRREEDYAAIGFVTSNNPYDNEKTPFCESICRQKLWPIDVKTPGLGKTVCCPVSDMLRKMNFRIPIKKIDSKSGRFTDLRRVKNVLVMPP